MDLTTDFFTLFQLPRLFRLDLSALEARYLEIQGEVHPDRFVQADERARRLAAQWAARVNEGCLTLKKPLERAKYLLFLAGHDLEAERNTVMEPAFLIEQMEWREAAAEARNGRDHHALERLHHRLHQDLAGRYRALAALLDDQRDWPAAAHETRRLMFLEKLRLEIDDALAALEDEGIY